MQKKSCVYNQTKTTECCITTHLMSPQPPYWPDFSVFWLLERTERELWTTINLMILYWIENFVGNFTSQRWVPIWYDCNISDQNTCTIKRKYYLSQELQDYKTSIILNLVTAYHMVCGFWYLKQALSTIIIVNICYRPIWLSLFIHSVCNILI